DRDIFTRRDREREIVEDAARRLAPERFGDAAQFDHGESRARLGLVASILPGLRVEWNEAQGDAVVAVAQAGGLRTVVENVAVMPAAFRAVIFGARHDELAIGLGREDAGNRREKAWPAGAAFELHRGGEKWQRAPGAGEHARAVLVVERARERALGSLVAQDAIRRRIERLPPFGIGPDDRRGVGGDFRILRQQRFPVALEVIDAAALRRRLRDELGGNDSGAQQQRGGETLQQQTAVHRASSRWMIDRWTRSRPLSFRATHGPMRVAAGRPYLTRVAGGRDRLRRSRASSGRSFPHVPDIGDDLAQRVDRRIAFALAPVNE